MTLPRISAVLFAAMISAQAAEKPAHVFILSGQSNMARVNPQADFLPEAKALFPDAEVAVIKVAKGGRPIREWVTEWKDIAKKHGIDPAKAQAKGKRPETAPEMDEDAPHKTVYYQPILDQWAALLKKHPNPKSVTFCWMQGESDSNQKLDAAYSDALKQLISNLRRDLARPDMNVVIGRLSDFGKPDNEPWQTVRNAQVAIAEQDARGAWVDCDDLNDLTRNGKPYNDLHYSAEGYKLLGQRYARQAKALIDGKEPAKDGRP